MDDFSFAAYWLETFRASPDAIKALILTMPLILCLGMVALVLHHLRAVRRMDRDYQDLREARHIQRERWLQGCEGGFRRRLAETATPKMQAISVGRLGNERREEE